MARLVGVDLPREKRLEIALTYIFGIGRTRSQETIAATGLDPNKRVKDLTDDELVKLRDHIEANYKVEGDLPARSPPTFDARSRSVAIRASGTVAACPSAGNAPVPTRVPARAPSAPSPARRSRVVSNLSRSA